MSISTSVWGSSSMFTTPPLSVSSSTSSYATTAASQTTALDPFANLNLSSSQQTQIQSIINSASSSNLSFSQVQQQIDAVLTPTQVATLKSDIQGIKSHHHHGSASAAQTSDGDTDAFGVSTASNASSTTPTQTVDPFSTIAASYSVQAQLQNLTAF